MIPVDTTNCLAHILVCTNSRDDSSMPCCAEAGAEKIHAILAHWLDEHHLRTRIWLTRTNCLGWCHVGGTTVVFYPDNKWYRAVQPDDCPTLIARHLAPLIDEPT